MQAGADTPAFPMAAYYMSVARARLATSSGRCDGSSRRADQQRTERRELRGNHDDEAQYQRTAEHDRRLDHGEQRRRQQRILQPHHEGVVHEIKASIEWKAKTITMAIARRLLSAKLEDALEPPRTIMTSGPAGPCNRFSAKNVHSNTHMKYGACISGRFNDL